MRIESPAFTRTDLEVFVDQLLDQERLALARRLDAASARLQALAPRLRDGASDGVAEWSANEVLAHIAVLSKFYGMLTYKVGSGALTEVDLLENVHMRDPAGEQLARLPVAQLIDIAVADQARTAAYLRGADAAAMRNRADFGGGIIMTMQEVATLPLCAHLEQHVEQLERQLEQES